MGIHILCKKAIDIVLIRVDVFKSLSLKWNIVSKLLKVQSEI